jgi:periplasmic copper chaperone A
MKIKCTLFLGGMSVLALSTAFADPIQTGSLVVDQVWARATIPSAKSGVVYLTVRNTGSQADRIISLEAPVAGEVMAMRHGTSKPGEVGELIVPPSGSLEFKPGETHIMLSDLNSGLKVGQQFPLTITFEKAGTVRIPIKVGKPAAMGPE